MEFNRINIVGSLAEELELPADVLIMAMSATGLPK
ncbi:MAG: hypothetical protein ACI9A1_001753, partial [Lentimonas sp.]